jgi:hypothetical protein
MVYLDDRCDRVQPESIRKTFDSVLFSSRHRRMVTYFVSALGIPIDIILSTYSTIWSEPLLIICLYSISFLVIAIGSVFFSGMRDKKLSRLDNAN